MSAAWSSGGDGGYGGGGGGRRGRKDDKWGGDSSWHSRGGGGRKQHNAPKRRDRCQVPGQPTAVELQARLQRNTAKWLHLAAEAPRNFGEEWLCMHCLSTNWMASQSCSRCAQHSSRLSPHSEAQWFFPAIVLGQQWPGGLQVPTRYPGLTVAHLQAMTRIYNEQKLAGADEPTAQGYAHSVSPLGPGQPMPVPLQTPHDYVQALVIAQAHAQANQPLPPLPAAGAAALLGEPAGSAALVGGAGRKSKSRSRSPRIQHAAPHGSCLLKDEFGLQQGWRGFEIGL